MSDLFNVIVAENKLHENFLKVLNNPGHEAGRIMVNEVFNSVKALDSDFIVQFQTKFDPRIWELILLATFQEAKFDIVRQHESPDFELIKDGQKIFVEAVTTNPPFNGNVPDKLELLKNVRTQEDWNQLILPLRIDSTMKLASGLTYKLNKKYWTKKWVAGHPLILAIEPFHHSLSHMLSDSNLTGYLYGIDHLWNYDGRGNLNIETLSISKHEHNEKKIPSNFFALPDAENISAVIFSNCGTISKFTRIGKQKGFGKNTVIIERVGNRYDHDPNAAVPIPFKYLVGVTGPIEDWKQGIAMFHNPRAKHPIDRKLFPGMYHGYFEEHFYAYIPDFWPIMSETNIYIGA